MIMLLQDYVRMLLEGAEKNLNLLLLLYASAVRRNDREVA